jgi:hypothetical protein
MSDNSKNGASSTSTRTIYVEVPDGDGRTKTISFTDEQADWNFSKENPLAMNIVVWKDRERDIADVITVAVSRCTIVLKNVQLSRIARPVPSIIQAKG